MLKLPHPEQTDNDIWQYLAAASRPIVMYGMGNGADKILSVFEKYNIRIADFFASDEFVRGHTFHEKRVLSFSEIKEKYDDFIIVLAFGSSRAEVMHLIDAIDGEFELYAPDVPVCGETLFTAAYYQRHYDTFQSAYAAFADDASKEVYANLIRYKLTAKIKYLRAAASYKNDLLPFSDFQTMIDAGAYVGDTAKDFIDRAAHPKIVYAIEPDAHSFKRLSKYAGSETRAAVLPFHFCIGDRAGSVSFTASGNRNARIGGGIELDMRTVDSLSVQDADYIKYDVEGAELAALYGSKNTISASHPALLISCYHRTEDLFILPQALMRDYPAYSLYLRKEPSYPAWDINLIAIYKKENTI